MFCLLGCLFVSLLVGSVVSSDINALKESKVADFFNVFNICFE